MSRDCARRPAFQKFSSASVQAPGRPSPPANEGERKGTARQVFGSERATCRSLARQHPIFQYLATAARTGRGINGLAVGRGKGGNGRAGGAVSVARGRFTVGSSAKRP